VYRIAQTICLCLLLSVTCSHAADIPAKAGAGQRLKTIIVDNYHPYTFLNEKGEPDGFSVEIARAVSKTMDFELEIREDKWDVAMKRLEAGSIDFLPMMANSPERHKLFDFSVPHTIAYDTIFLKKGNATLRTLKDLSGKTVIVMNKDIVHSYLLSSGLSNTMTLNLVDSLPEALQQLSAGKGDAAIMPKLVGIVTAKKLDLSNIETSPQLIDSYTRPFSFAVKNGNQELLERLNQGLNIIKSSGEYDAIYKKWFGALEASRLSLKTVIKFVSVAALILFGVIAWNIMLKRQVKLKTDHLEAEIIQRKQAEETLKESNDKFISLADNVPGFVAYVNAQTMQYEYVNDAFEKSFGIPRNKIIGSHIKELLGETNYQFALPYIDKVKSGEPASYENAFNLDLGKRWIRVNYNPVFNANGQVVSIVVLSYDITERRQAEEQLENLTQRLRLATDSAHLGVWDWNVRDNVMVWDDRMFELYGITRTTFPNNIDAWLNGLHPDDKETALAECQAALNGEQEFDTEFRVLHPDGTVKYLKANALVIRGSDGTAERMIGINFDISESKQIEDALIASEHHYRTLFDNSLVGVTIVDCDNVVIEANEAFCSLLEYGREELLGKMSIADITFPSDQDKSIEMVRKLKNNELDHYSLEKQYLSKTGKIIPALIYVRGMYKPDGTYDGCTASILDITERKHTEELLIQAKNDWESTFDAVTDMITVQDSDFNIIRANLAAKQILGLPSLAQAKCFKYYHGTEQPLADCPSCESLTTGVCCTVEMYEPHLCKHLEIRAMPRLGNDGEVVSLIHVIRDITERKTVEEEKTKLESQLLQAQKMESVGRLAGGVAHDFNNLLTVILGYSQIGLMESDPESPITAYLDQISKTADRAADLTRQLLAFARKQTIAPKVLDMNETVSGMLKMLQRLLGEDIHLAWHPAPDLWPVKLDPSQIDQLLANLCVNARDSITDIGKITIETGNNIIGKEYCDLHAGFSPGEYVRLSVSDNGCGMDKVTQVQIFEPFFTTKGLGEGTGLGLSTVYGIVKQNNGFINVYSEPGLGTTFTIYLPKYEGNIVLTRKEISSEPAMRGQETILLVEDEEVILNIAKVILTKQGYTILAASTPNEAITLAREHAGEVHLLMTDVVMPEMNGRDLANTLQSLYPQLKCLFMSGYTANVIAHHGVLDDGVFFIQKPFSLPDLAVKVREVLNSVVAG